MGVLYGVLTGDIVHGASFGLFFELLWLDLIPAGSYVPPNSLLALAVSLAVASQFGLCEGGSCSVALAMGVPAGLAGSMLERRHRAWMDVGYNRLLAWAEGKPSGWPPGRTIGLALATQAGMNVVLFGVCVLAAFGALGMARQVGLGLFSEMATQLTWPHLWFAAAVGGVLALRIRSAYIGFGGAVAVGGAFLVLG